MRITIRLTDAEADRLDTMSASAITGTETAGGGKLVEDARLVATTGALIAAVNAGQGLAFGGQTHGRNVSNHEYESTYRQTPRPPPRPGNI